MEDDDLDFSDFLTKNVFNNDGTWEDGLLEADWMHRKDWKKNKSAFRIANTAMKKTDYKIPQWMYIRKKNAQR